MNIYIETLGCAKNMEDSEATAGILERAGHHIIDEPQDADAILVNTCGFINDAKTESIERIFDMASCKNEDALLIVSGCLAQRYGDELFKEMPEADIFLGVNDYENLPEILRKHEIGKREKHFSLYEKEFPQRGKRKLLGDTYSCFLKIAEGCDNVCAYCVIPAIRGPYRSRKEEEILAEAKWLADQGCKELILVAQDVTAYGMDLYGEFRLAQLLKKLCQIAGIRWIRLMYCYEDRITDELIAVMADEEKICHYIDIPLQHISNQILKAMNRRSTGATIRNTIKRLRQAIPDIHIRTTFITGFPGERQEDFQELADFVDEMQFERLGVFSYSQEEGTPAATMKGQVRSDVKERRQEALMRQQLEISLALNEKKIGTVQEVMVEAEDEAENTYLGRTKFDAPEIDNGVIFTARQTLKPGDIVSVRITDAFDYDLCGEMEEGETL